MNKSTIRTELLRQRRQMDDALIQKHSAKIIAHICASTIFKEASQVALYLPINGEVDLSALMTDSDKNFYLPSINQQTMQFHRHHSQLILKQHRFGCLQPEFKADHVAPDIDLCLLPLVGFDHQGNRLGMGGGYYDRYFADNDTTILAGIAYLFQQVEQLPTDSWDVKLQHIFTEQGHLKI